MSANRSCRCTVQSQASVPQIRARASVAHASRTPVTSSSIARKACESGLNQRHETTQLTKHLVATTSLEAPPSRGCCRDIGISQLGCGPVGWGKPIDSAEPQTRASATGMPATTPSCVCRRLPKEASANRSSMSETTCHQCLQLSFRKKST